MQPMISVIIPCFNNEGTIRMCVDSLLGQTYDNFEIIVVDDGSDDNPSQALADAGAQALDLGHLDVEYEWMRSGCTSKEPVRGKYVNEAYLSGKSASAVSEELSVSELQLYKSQIIADFSK